MAERPSEQLQAQVDAIVDSGALGKSDAYPRLLRYLAERSGRPPKEIEIAIDVFGRDETFDVTQDSLVRVYIHKLRQRLEQYYQGVGKDAPFRLEIPKGSYVVAASNWKPDTKPGVLERWQTGPGKWLAAGLIAGVVLTLLLQMFQQNRGLDELAIAHQPWLPLLQNDRPLLLVVGSHFVFSELNQNFEQLREIRNFSINDASQFQRFIQESDENANRFRDLGVRYLPGGTAPALAELVRLFEGNAEWQIIGLDALAQYNSDNYNLLYLGPYSGLGELREQVFSRSNFSLHPNGLVLVDNSDGEVFANEGQLAEGYRDRYVDFGLFTRAKLPNGNWLYSLMSARDAGLEQTARLLTSAGALAALQARVEPAEMESLEILVEVSGTAAGELQPQVRLVRPLREQ